MGSMKEPVSSLYDSDFLGWTHQQVAALRAREPERLDYENLIEEIESMGKQLQAELVNRLAVLLAHLLKWQFQPAVRDRHGRSWQLSAKEQRLQIAKLVHNNPSLAPFIADAMAGGYEIAVLRAARESGFDEHSFPPANPYVFEQAMQPDWMPN